MRAQAQMRENKDQEGNTHMAHERTHSRGRGCDADEDAVNVSVSVAKAKAEPQAEDANFVAFFSLS